MVTSHSCGVSFFSRTTLQARLSSFMLSALNDVYWCKDMPFAAKVASFQIPDPKCRKLKIWPILDLEGFLRKLPIVKFPTITKSVSLLCLILFHKVVIYMSVIGSDFVCCSWKCLCFENCRYIVVCVCVSRRKCRFGSRIAQFSSCIPSVWRHCCCCINPSSVFIFMLFIVFTHYSYYVH